LKNFLYHCIFILLKHTFFLPLLLFLVLTLQAQAISPSVTNDEKLSFVGMTLTQLIERFGAPRAVAASRGNESWQDDVVFQYADADFFIHKDRVWQARFSAACGISTRDRKAAVMLLLGNTAEDRGDHVLLSVPGRDWPTTIRVNFNNSGQVTAIYIYRPDY
jgi:hypothetical protein